MFQTYHLRCWFWCTITIFCWPFFSCQQSTVARHWWHRLEQKHCLILTINWTCCGFPHFVCVFHLYSSLSIRYRATVYVSRIQVFKVKMKPGTHLLTSLHKCHWTKCMNKCLQTYFCKRFLERHSRVGHLDQWRRQTVLLQGRKQPCKKEFSLNKIEENILTT